MDRYLMLPDRALVDTLNQQLHRELAVQTRGFGAGASRVVRQSGSISVAPSTTQTLISTTVDPGDWSISFFALLRNELFGLGRSHDIALTLSMPGGPITVPMRRWFPGNHTDQIGSVTLRKFDVIAALELSFAWTTDMPSPSNYLAYDGFISLVPS